MRAKRRLLFIAATSFIILIIFAFAIFKTHTLFKFSYSSFRSSPFFHLNVGYLAYIWAVMLHIMIFHVWIFQSLTKISPTSIGMCIFQTCFFCCICCFSQTSQSVIQIDENIANLEKEITQQKIVVDIHSGDIQSDGNKTTNKLTIDVIGPVTTNNNNDKQSQIARHPRNESSNINLTSNLNKKQGLTPFNSRNALTPFSPGTPGLTDANYPDINISKNYNDIKAVIYDINILLSVAYTAKDALEHLQNRPIEWMTNKYVKDRIFNLEPNRSNEIKNHIEFVKHRGNKKICIMSNGFGEMKMKILINMLGIDKLIDKIVSKDYDKWNVEQNNISVVLLDIMSEFQCENQEILFVSNELDQMNYLQQIELCSLYPVYQIMEKIKIAANLTSKDIKKLNKNLIQTSTTTTSNANNDKNDSIV